MQDHPVLGQVALGYSPMIDKQRAVVAVRLTVFPETPDARPDVEALLAALDEVWPPADAEPDLQLSLRALDAGAQSTSRNIKASSHKPLLVLNIAGETLLHAVMAAGPGAHRMLEVPAFMAGDPAHVPLLSELQAQGAILLIKGRPLAPLPPEVLGCFAHSLVEFDDDRRAQTYASTGTRQVSPVYAGIRTSADAKLAFERGAVAVLGWPYDDLLPTAGSRATVPADVTVVMELIQGVNAEWPVPRLEAVLKRDPTVAFKLMRYLNSPAFGLSVEITSFGHALMLLGYDRLKRWLALLLASARKDSSMQPVLYAAVRRGLLMEELVRPQRDSDLSSEMFICGVFSLLDRLLQQPLESLLASVPVPERVQLALRGEGGPHLPYLNLVRAMESESLFDIRECTEQLFLGPAEVNRALLMAMRAARQLE